MWRPKAKRGRVGEGEEASWEASWPQQIVTFLLFLGDNSVNFIRLGNVQLGSISHFLKIWALVQSTA